MCRCPYLQAYRYYSMYFFIHNGYLCAVTKVILIAAKHYFVQEIWPAFCPAGYVE